MKKVLHGFFLVFSLMAAFNFLGDIIVSACEHSYLYLCFGGCGFAVAVFGMIAAYGEVRKA